MPPGAADVFLLAMVGLGAGALGLAGGIWASYRDAAKDNTADDAGKEKRGYRP